MAAPVEPSGSEPPQSELQILIRDTLDVPSHLLAKNHNGADLHMAYTKYIAIQDAIKQLSKLNTAGLWPTKKMPSLDTIVGVFMSKSAYHTNYSKVFAAVVKHPEMEKWLQNADDAPADAEVWGEYRPSFENLKKIVMQQKQKKGSKGKKRQIDSSSPVRVVGKGKEKMVESASDSEVKGRKAKVGNSGKKTAGSSKNRRL